MVGPVARSGRAPGVRLEPSSPEASHACLPVSVDVSSSALCFLADQLRRRRRTINSRWRRLTAGHQALLALAHLRLRHAYPSSAIGFDVGITTAYRYVAEAIKLLAVSLSPWRRRPHHLREDVRAPGQHAPADRPHRGGPAPLLGKRKKHSMNVQVLTDRFGRLLWALPALPGLLHDV
jgi:hypothetical protein